MSETTTDPIVLPAEAIAQHLAWRLSNSSAEIDRPDDGVFYDVAFDTDRDGDTVTLSVSSWEADSGRRGHQLFEFTVAHASSPETGQ